MKRYTYEYTKTVIYRLTVKADTEEEAQDKAIEELPYVTPDDIHEVDGNLRLVATQGNRKEVEE